MHLKNTIWIGISFLITTCIGATLLIIAARLYADAVVREHAHNWVPLTFPVSLVPGTIRTPDITTDFDGDYEIVIEFEKIYGIHKMECLLGTESLNPNNRFLPFGLGTCKGIPNLIDISWKLLDGEATVSEGDSGNYPAGVTWSATVERMIGKFRGQIGHRYVLLLEVKRDASQLNVAKPRIKVQVPPLGAPKDYGVGTGIARMEATMLGLVGAIILVGPFLLWKLRRRTIP